MLRAFCIIIPIVVLLLPLFMDASIVWILNVLLTSLGTVFSYINYKYRKDKLSLGILIINALLFLFYIYRMINFFI